MRELILLQLIQTDQESTGISASYTMGGMTLAGAMNEVDNMEVLLTKTLKVIRVQPFICILINLENKFKKRPLFRGLFFIQNMKFLQY